MEFKIKRDNYKNFDVFKDNVLYPRSYFIPFDDVEEMAKSDIRTERYSSSIVEVLSGEWDFAYFEKISLAPTKLDVDTFEFDKVQVPSVWQHTGYEEPYYVNTRYQFDPKPPVIPEDIPMGVYHKCFAVEDLDKNYILTFLGVAGGLEVYVNGKYVGYSEGSHNTAEFELDEYLVEGENHLLVVNHKWTNGTYLECQDMFRCNGIFRDVLLTKYQKNSLYDFEAKTTFNNDATYNLSVIPALKLVDECELSASIFDGNELISSKSINVDANQIDKIDFSSLEVEEWSAESPKLYDLIISLSKDGEIVQIVRRPIGFKHIKITGNVFTFNQKNIKLLGVNHHDTNPKTGYVMTIEDMEKDIAIFKEYNVNCVRTSHYPPDPAFLDLCDEYGIYVVDEADIETHGCETELHRPGSCSHNPAWKEHYWDRVYRMYQRDRNHPSITMWSLGNEAHGYSNQDYCYNELKKITNIPVHYEGVCRTRRWAYDVVSQMYPHMSIVEKIANGKGLPKKFYTKPYYMCEYAHAMGLGAGELETYVKAILRGNNMLGGCIWEFVDHAIYHEGGKYEYTYGGDHGEWKHDGNFCVDGLFFPDRTPHSGALQMKSCYRPVRVAQDGENTFKFHNYKYFTNASYKVCWSYLVNGVEEQAGEIELDIAPQKNQSVTLDITKKAGDQAVIFTYFDGEREIAKEQVVEFAENFKVELCEDKTAPTVHHSEKKIYVRFNDGELVFDTSNGTVTSYKKAGVEFINTAPFGNDLGFGVSTYRAPTDNDRNIKFVWNKLALANQKLYPATKNKKSVCRTEGNEVVIEYSYAVNTIKSKNLCKVTMLYKISNDGSVRLTLHCDKSKSIPFAPRFGLTLEMPREFENVEYYGLGDKVNVSDFNSHAVLGIYNTKVDDMHEEYIKPQESSQRTEVRYAKVTNEDGKGLCFTSLEDRMTFSADHYTSAQCAKAMHKEELQRCNTTMLHFDSYHMGVGSNSCGPVPTSAYRKSKLNNEQITLLINPIV